MLAKTCKENHLLRLFAGATMLVSCLVFFVVSINAPVQNWDMLGYAGSVLSLGDSSSAALHAQVYNEFRAYATLAEFHELTQTTSYRQVMLADADAFVQQIPFYKIRIAFVMLLALLAKVGINLFEAQHLLSAGFASAGLFLLFLGLREHIHSIFWLTVPFFFFQFTQDLLIVRFGAVDSFAFFWVVLTILAYLYGSLLLLPLLALSVLVRTDLILYVGLMFALIFASDYSKWKLLALWGAVCAGLYLWVNQWAGNYGWQTVFHFVFVTDMEATHPLQYRHIGVSFQQYLEALVQPQWITKWLWFSVVAAMASWFIYHVQLRLVQPSAVVARIVALGVVAILYVAVHYVLFPAIFMRFFTAQFLIMSMALMATATTWLRLYVLAESSHSANRQCV